MLFSVSGFPRGGTHFASGVFMKWGYNIAHGGAMGRHGICDWRMCWTSEIPKKFQGELLHYPNFHPDYKIMVIRNPYHIISTWTQLYDYPLNVTKEQQPYMLFDFVEGKHGKCIYDNKIERATDCFLKWYDLNVSIQPDVIVKVEEMLNTLGDFLVKEKVIEKRFDVNEHGLHRASTKFTNKRIPKDEILNAIPEKLKIRLNEICEKYSYKEKK